MLHLANRYARRLLLAVLIFMGLALIACDGPPAMAPGDSGYAGEVAMPTTTPEPTVPSPDNFADMLGEIKSTGNTYILVTSESQMTFQVDDQWNVARDFHNQVGDATMLIVAGYFQEDGSILVCRLKMQEIVIDRCPIARG